MRHVATATGNTHTPWPTHTDSNDPANNCRTKLAARVATGIRREQCVLIFRKLLKNTFK